MVKNKHFSKSLALFGKVFLSFALMFTTVSAFAEETIPRFNLRPGVTPISKDIYDLHMTIFWICVAIGVVVFSLLFYALLMHRKARGVKPAKFHEHKSIEIIWAIIPLVILIIMAIPATLVLMRMANTDDSALTIKVTGYQWKWQYSYLDQGIEFFSNLKTPYEQIHNKERKDNWYLLEVDKPLVVPIDEKIRFLITSNDVIHSWFVPSLGIKKDAMPGFIHEAWAEIKKPGTYRGQCAELCGAYHAYMPIVIKAVTQPEFEAWVKKERGLEQKQQREQIGESAETKTPAKTLASKDQKASEAATKLIEETDEEKPVKKHYTANELMESGRKDYNKYCAACHQADGRGIPPIYPALHADSVAVGGSIARHIEILLHGIPGTAMQAFGKQLDDFQIAAIVTYERNAWGNRTGDVIQPEQVAKLRKKAVQKTREKEKKQIQKDLQNLN